MQDICVNEKMAQIGPQLHNDQKLDLSLGRKSTERLSLSTGCSRHW